MNKILITGGAGFIGYHLAKKLSEQNNYVVILDNFRRGKKDKEFEKLIEKDNIKFIEGDISKLDTFFSLDKDFDFVYHLAAVIGVRIVEQRPLDVLKVNSLSITNLVEWIKTLDNKPKVMFSSTSEIYAGALKVIGERFPVPTDEKVPFALENLDMPRNTYAFSKAFGEMYIKFASEEIGFDYSIVRYHNVYGPRMGTLHVIPELIIRAIKAKEELEVFSPFHTRAFCYIDDAVNATILSITTDSLINQTINIGNDLEEIKIKDLAKIILNVINRNDIEIIEGNTHAGSPARRCPDIKLLKNNSDYIPKVSLKKGIIKTYEWYKNHLELTE